MLVQIKSTKPYYAQDLKTGKWRKVIPNPNQKEFFHILQLPAQTNK